MGPVYALFGGILWEPATRGVTHAARGNGTRAAAVVLTALPAVPLPFYMSHQPVLVKRLLF